jgi:hypothetical protein
MGKKFIAFVVFVFFVSSFSCATGSSDPRLEKLERQINKHISLVKKVASLHLFNTCDWHMEHIVTFVSQDKYFIEYINKISQQGCLNPLYELWQMRGTRANTSEYVQFVRQFLVVLLLVYRDFLSQLFTLDKEAIESALVVLQKPEFLGSIDLIMSALEHVYSDLSESVFPVMDFQSNSATLLRRGLKLWPLWAALGVICAVRVVSHKKQGWLGSGFNFYRS